MDILHKLADGTVEVRESYDINPFSTEDDRSKLVLAMNEAASEGKRTKLVARIAAMPEGITRNKTFYPVEELERSVPTWTDPYPCPVIKDHNEWEVDNIVGRINEAFIAPDGTVKALWFEVSILDPEAQEKVTDGTWAQVSIGTRVSSAVCSICGNDWAKGTWCEHERGNYYLKDENDPDSVTECFWIMGGVTGREVSFVTTPSAPRAGVRSVKQAEAKENEAKITIDRVSLFMADENELDQLRALESVKFGSPSSNGEANVPSSEKEESVPKADKVEDEVLDAEATEQLSDAPEGKEDAEVEEATEDTEVDGQGAEEAAEDEGESQSEDEESEESASEDESDPTSTESGEDAEAEGEESDQQEEAGEEDDERTKLLATIADLNAQVISLKAQLYVESGLRDGILAGERDALVGAHVEMTESTLDELIDSVSKRRSTVSMSEELLKHKVASPVLKTGDDDAADEALDTDVTVSVKTEGGSHVVRLHEDTTPVTITPKLK